MNAKRTQTLAVALMGMGTLIAIIYFIKPFQVVFDAFSSLPGPLQVAVGLVLVGLAVLIISLLIERWTDRDADAALKDESPHP